MDVITGPVAVCILISICLILISSRRPTSNALESSHLLTPPYPFSSFIFLFRHLCLLTQRVPKLLPHAAIRLVHAVSRTLTLDYFSAPLDNCSGLLLSRWDKCASRYSVQWYSERVALLRGGSRLSNFWPGGLALIYSL